MRGESGLGEVPLADRGPAGHHHQIGDLQQLARHFAQAIGFVGAHVERDDIRTGLACERRHREPDRFGNGIGARVGVAGPGQLVTGGKDRDPRPQGDRHLGVIGRGCGDQRARDKPGARRQQRIARREIAARGANVAGRAIAGGEAHARAIALRVLLDDHSRRTRRNRRPGEYARRLTCFERARPRSARARFADHLEPPVRCGRVTRHRVAIHRRDRRTRGLAAGDQVCGQRSPRRVGERNRLAAQWVDLGDQRQSRVEGDRRAHARPIEAAGQAGARSSRRARPTASAIRGGTSTRLSTTLANICPSNRSAIGRTP